MALVTDESVVIDEQTISIVELCHSCALPIEQVLIMVEYGIIEPLEFQTSHIRWQFTGSNVIRLQTVQRLQRDLDVNLAGAALALELLDEIKMLRRLKV
ncbi:MAG: MerR family transcriptional regulator [Methylophaga sp.]|nr:MerR family transcriptional regulator [Methylophaga sp.]